MFDGITVLSPHPDDEIIGCFRIIDHVDYVIYFDGLDQTRIKESNDFCDTNGISCVYWSIEGLISGHGDVELTNIVYAPDPFTEIHPLHKIIGMAACVLRSIGRIKELHLYSTNMITPWVREVKNSNMKLYMLEHYYPSQKSLWEHDHKYFLFESDIIWPAL
jgi:hypothetical protein